MKKVHLILLVLILSGCSMLVAEKPEVNQDVVVEEKAVVATVEPVAKEVDKKVMAPEVSLGRITGALSYPSEGIPKDMTVCAEPVNEGEEICTDTHIKLVEKQYGVGYELEVPAGEYRVYAYLKSSANKQKAYYSEFVTCGLKYGCPSHEPIVVTVAAGETTDDVHPHDWYVPQE